MRWINDTLIDTDLERLWRLTLAVDGLPTVSPKTVLASEPITPGPLRPGSEVALTQPRLGRTIWTVREVSPPHRFVWERPLGWLTLTATHELSEVDGDREGGQVAHKVNNRLAIDLTGFAAGLVGALVSSQIRRAIETENAGYKRAAESVGA